MGGRGHLSLCVIGSFATDYYNRYNIQYCYTKMEHFNMSILSFKNCLQTKPSVL